MKNLAYLFSLVVLFQLFSIGSNALAQQNRSRPAGANSAPKDPLELYKKAGINSEQESEIIKLMKGFESAHKVRMKSLFGLMKDMRSLQLQPFPSEEEVLEKQEEINKLSGDIATERIKLMLKIRKLLTPPQRQKLVQLVRIRANVPEDRKGR